MVDCASGFFSVDELIRRYLSEGNPLSLPQRCAILNRANVNSCCVSDPDSTFKFFVENEEQDPVTLFELHEKAIVEIIEMMRVHYSLEVHLSSEVYTAREENYCFNYVSVDSVTVTKDDDVPQSVSELIRNFDILIRELVDGYEVSRKRTECVALRIFQIIPRGTIPFRNNVASRKEGTFNFENSRKRDHSEQR
jgi:hypothetical protein